MIRLFRYLKPYVGYIVLVIGLLFLQANADLALPDYMSKIVNVGIQQSGIENSVPQVIGSKSFDKLVLFLSPEAKTTVLSSYDIVKPEDSAYQALLKKYPKAEGETLYILKKIDDQTKKTLDGILGPSLTTVAFIETASSDPSKAGVMA